MNRRRPPPRLLGAVAFALALPTLLHAQVSLTVQVGQQRQRIDGFGASSAWTAQNITDAQADLFFSTTTGVGLSLLRVRIAPSGNTWETATAQKAVARGVRVWATPWSPPGAWKSNGTDNNGGTLLPEYYDDWAARLAQSVVTMQNAGIPLVAISSQNEPNWTATWETCRWTPTELTTFIRDYLGPALAARGVATRVIGPETIDWYTIDDYGNVLLADATARSFVSHVATHSYGGTAFAYTVPSSYGLPFWQTEFSDNVATSDPTISSALRVAAVIHDFLTIAEGNAWHYWWMYPSTSGGSSTGALVEANAMTKRGWALGNWARFVRPDQRRVVLTGSTSSLKATAFVEPGGRRLSIVAINSGSSAQTLNVNLQGGTVTTLVPWETSAARSLESLPAITSAGSSFSAVVPAQSVTTFVAAALNRPPTSLSLTTSGIIENLPAGTAIGRPVATDPDPGETFTYELVSGAGSTDNALFTLSGGFLRSAGPLDYEAGATRTVRLRATDAAGASIEQALTVTVVNSTAEYADWSATLPVSERGADADPNGDGAPNLLAYALGRLPSDRLPAADAPSPYRADPLVGLRFVLPAQAPADVRYQIERSDDLATWTALASKSGAGAWTGSVAVQTQATADGRSQVTLTETMSGEKRFYRLAASLLP